MNLKISYSKDADKFLSKNQNKIKEEKVDKLIISAVKKILKIEESNVDLKKLKSKQKGSFRIRKGDIRIIFSLKKDKIPMAFINHIDFRGNIYKKYK